MTLPHIAQPRILFYAVNGLGLGHVTRLLAIARAIRAERGGAQILFMTTTEADSVIYREGFASIKIPSKTIINESRIRPSTYNKLAHSVVMNTVASFNPAILVADTFPAGASQELLSTLSWEMRRVFVYRAQQSARAADPFFQAALGAYDLGVVPHVEGTEEIPAPSSLRLVWTGPIMIRDAGEVMDRHSARRRLNVPAEGKLLYVTVGGGGDEEMTSAEGMIVMSAHAAGWTVVSPDAPLQRPLIGAELASPDFRVSYYPMAECFRAFDACVGAAGYNTVNELEHFGIPALLIPRSRGLDDQFKRAAEAEQGGAALVADLDQPQIEAKLRILHDDDTLRSQMSAAGRRLVPGNGAKTAAQEILGLL